VIRVVLPAHLRTLARVSGEVKLEVEGEVTVCSVLDALEASYPMLSGTIRDHATHQRRPYVRFFACQEDLSHDPADTPLPEAVAQGSEPLLVVGAIAGGCTAGGLETVLRLGRMLPVHMGHAEPYEPKGAEMGSEGGNWSGRRDLNPGPLAPQASALARLRHGPKQLV
jgi:sulfur-carrier protein